MVLEKKELILFVCKSYYHFKAVERVRQAKKNKVVAFDTMPSCCYDVCLSVKKANRPKKEITINVS